MQPEKLDCPTLTRRGVEEREEAESEDKETSGQTEHTESVLVACDEVVCVLFFLALRNCVSNNDQ